MPGTAWYPCEAMTTLLACADAIRGRMAALSMLIELVEPKEGLFTRLELSAPPCRSIEDARDCRAAFEVFDRPLVS